MPSPDKPPPSKWAIGVELHEAHLGPVRFASALARTDEDLALGIHALPDLELLHPLVNQAEAKQMHEKVASQITALMAQAGHNPAQVRVELVEDAEIERGLAEASVRLGVDALVIGRRANRDEDPIVRLGEVARKILRRLPVPVVVVPPDFGSEGDPGLGDGPVIVGVDLTGHGATATRFAAGLAKKLGRPLMLAHGTQAFAWGISYIPAASMETLQAQTRAGAGQKLREWAGEMGLEDAKQHVFMGDPAKQLSELAVAEDAAILVTGSRMLGVVERLFLSSVSSELAATARCPVAVVPGD
ncbi:Universal stress protein family protein [Enhygromyxa salina]|uniref:Universal stress protein family protein n=1 Tax=Enhygromyxa salina TaxID=215803 RepID=A0A0C2D2E0_9BACT|nr:universal stress protein [Enhygromyxa salina]KIG17446.1 Universal stress protein family protein [Enhygromyxa salina]